MRPWAKLPTWWYREDYGLQQLLGGKQAGESQAALRVYLAAAILDERPVDSFEVVASLSRLEDVTGLSRPTVTKGLDRAEEAKLIRITRGGPTAASKIQLVCPEHEQEQAGGWAKLPGPEVLKRVPEIPHRGVGGLTALKIYATLIAARPNDDPVVKLRHMTLRAKTGVQSRDVRRGITLLGNVGLIDVNSEDPAFRWGLDNEQGRQAHRYLLHGKFDTRRGQLAIATPNPASSLTNLSTNQHA